MDTQDTRRRVMKVGDRVWCTASAQQLWDSDNDYTDRETTFLLHTYGMIQGLSRSLDMVYVTFSEFCIYEDGNSPVAVWLPRDWLKVAVLDEDYLNDDYDNPNFTTFA